MFGPLCFSSVTSVLAGALPECAGMLFARRPRGSRGSSTKIEKGIVSLSY